MRSAAIESAPVEVTLIERRNHHLFQPLLCKIATSSLSPGEIVAPLRCVLSRQENTRMLKGEVQDIDPISKRVLLGDGASLEYGSLIALVAIEGVRTTETPYSSPALTLFDSEVPMAASFRRTCILILAFLHTLFPLASCGQQTAASSSGTLQLTLKQAVQLALQENPQRVIARLLIFESDRNSQIARSPLLPQAGLEANGSINQYNFQSIERGHRQDAGPFQVIEAGPTFSQTIFNLPLLRGYQIGREGSRQSRADEVTTRENVVTAVVDQYLLILRALATRDAANARVALAQRLYEQATELQKTGIGLNIDTVRANVELQNERQNLIDAETLTHTTKYGLAELLDLPRDQDLEVTDHLDFYDLPKLEKETLLSQALAARPEIHSLNSQQRIAQLTTDSAREQRLPQLDFSGFWLYQGSRFNNGIPAYTYEVALQFPIFTGGRIRAEEARAKLEEQHVAEVRRQVEARIVDEVKSSLDQLTAARNSVDVANLGLQLAQEEVAQAQRRFQAGVTTNIEVITAQDELARASDNQIGALYQFNLSRAALARATGTIETMYTK